MSRKTRTIEFTGGMNNVIPPHLIADNQAEEIRNLYLDKDGVWKDINNPEVMLDLSATHLANAVIVKQWKPTQVPSDCIDDFVYVVFCSNGVAKLVYRGVGALQIFTIDIKARIFGTTNYRAVTITGVTTDLDGNSTGTTSTSPSGVLSRRYYENTAITMTAPEEAGADEEFLHWIDADTDAILDRDQTLALVLTASRGVIAEYVGVPYIRVENVDEISIADLGTFTAIEGEYSEEKSYFVGGVSMANPIRVYPPEDFEIQKEGDGEVWIAYGSYIEISALAANSAMTQINVRYAPTEV